MSLKKTKPYLLLLILTSLAVSPAFALGEGNRNLLLIGVMSLSPVIIVYYGRFNRLNVWLVLFMASIILFPLIFHPKSMRWSTVSYSVMFCLTFMAYNELLKHSYFTSINYLKLLKYLIYAFAITLLIQQFCVLTGLPIFNISNYYALEPWKLNSLAAEPSHSARIVALLMYCYITIKELVTDRKYHFHREIKKDKWVWLAFIWTMATMGSGTAILFFGIVLLKFIRFRNLIPLFIIGGTLLFLVENFEITAIERTYKTVMATLTFDEKTIIKADHSASVRIVPFIILAKMVNLNSIDGWFGNGIDYVSSFLSDYLPGVYKGTSGGGLFLLWIEYGFISFVLFIIFSLSSSFKKGDYLSIVFWFLLVFLYGVNSQIVWLCLILLFTNNHFFKKQLKALNVNP